MRTADGFLGDCAGDVTRLPGSDCDLLTKVIMDAGNKQSLGSGSCYIQTHTVVIILTLSHRYKCKYPCVWSNMWFAVKN